MRNWVLGIGPILSSLLALLSSSLTGEILFSIPLVFFLYMDSVLSLLLLSQISPGSATIPCFLRAHTQGIFSSSAPARDLDSLLSLPLSFEGYEEV